MVVYLIPVATGFLSVYLAKVVYNRLVPREAVLWAMEVSRRYRGLEREAARSRRAAKKLREAAPEAKRARSIIFKSIIVKIGLLMAVYTVLGVVALTLVPAIPSPYKLPLITLDTPEGPVLSSLFAHFFSFLYAALLYRDEMV
ncbi:hypothetical protein APE_0980 [Aeropyrum pernix K1]|uniref:DUF106 domain-containing protein n=1 Tax=Aeropyrum pernix (strain ATCC 700893 / DSM 11879 / JCM 9820 / NBRC 100138 / K1) TaxID=272557 RepID=Q9YDD3_AERPE|nr:hypothetical protein [Aeropyrum pernix]BAA79964.1 hypothetical protein APE_0980 [Aeropyrum pernix K1]